MAEFKELGKIQFITDTDTEMYKMGEIQCGFNDSLKSYIKTYGIDNLLKEVSHLSYQIWETYRLMDKQVGEVEELKTSLK
jgi:hypothetical protein